MYSAEEEIQLQYNRVIYVQDLLKAFGAKVKLARIKKGYTQFQLAERLHTSDRTVSKIEKGQTNISLETAKSYAVELGFSLDELIYEPTPDSISYCVKEFFSGMDEVQAAKYIKLCEDARLLQKDHS